MGANLKHSKYLLIFQCVCAQSWPTLCDPVHYKPPGSPIHGIHQAGIMESVAISWWRLTRKVPLLNGAVSLAEKHRGRRWVDAGLSETVPSGGHMGFCGSLCRKSEFFILNYLPACNAGDPALIPGLGRSPGERNGNLLENSMDRGGCWATVHEVAKSQTWLSY